MRIIIASLIISMFLSYVNKEEIETVVIIVLSLRRSYDTSYVDRDIPSVRAYDINLSLVNKSTKPVSFWIMKCSWPNNFIIDGEKMSFYSEECNGNFPTVKNIKPSDSINYNASIFTLLTDESKLKKIRIGFIYVDAERYSSFNDYLSIMEDKSKQDSIIWSMPLQLD